MLARLSCLSSKGNAASGCMSTHLQRLAGHEPVVDAQRVPDAVDVEHGLPARRVARRKALFACVQIGQPSAGQLGYEMPARGLSRSSRSCE